MSVRHHRTALLLLVLASATLGIIAPATENAHGVGSMPAAAVLAQTSFGEHETPVVETDGNGTWIAGWTHGVFGPSHTYTGRSTDGVTWATPVQLNGPSTQLSGSNVDLAYGDGVWITVWDAICASCNDRDIMYSRSLDGGITWTAPDGVNEGWATDPSEHHESQPSLATDGSGNWLAVWQRSSVGVPGPIGNDRDIMVATSTDGGSTWNTPIPVNSDAPTDSAPDELPSLATDGAGHWVVVWDKNPDIMVSRSTDLGVTWSAMASLNSDSGAANILNRTPVIETDGQGVWVAGWESILNFAGNDWDLRFARSLDQGATWGAFASLNSNAATDTGSDFDLSLTPAGNNQWVALWHSIDAHASTSVDSGASWSTVSTISETTTGTDRARSPHAATDGTGTWVTVWGRGIQLSDSENAVMYTDCTYFDDADCDAVINSIDLVACGGDPYLSRRHPERTDGIYAGVDDDADGSTDEPLPAGANTSDCDGDGYTGTAEDNVFSAANRGDQDPCGTNAWPADFVSGGIPVSTNKVTITDLTSFIAPTMRINKSPGEEPAYNVRWDLVPGPGLFAKHINIADLSSLITVSPPMLGGVRALNGPTCPWAP